MLIASMFDGDDAQDLQLAQLRVSENAVVRLVDGAGDQLAKAEALLEVESSLGYRVRTNRFDVAGPSRIHDLLAAIWRARFGHTQAELPFPGRDASALANEWLRWLADWIAQAAPHQMRAILLAAYDTTDLEGRATEALLEELRRILEMEVRSLSHVREPETSR